MDRKMTRQSGGISEVTILKIGDHISLFNEGVCLVTSMDSC